MALLITIHDVTPSLAGRIQGLWRLCAARGVVPGLLVVPDWHGRSPIEGDRTFVEWISGCAKSGAEIFLHGERHDEFGLPRKWRDELRAAGRTNKEGEFLTLDYDAARSRVDRGLSRLRSLGFSPVGFVPPAWLAKPATHLAVRDAGLRVSENDSDIYVHTTGAVLPSPVVRWSARGFFRAYGSVVQERMRWALQRSAPVVRIALHPADLDHPATARSVVRGLDTWLGERKQTRYCELT
jgi:hypothetical protein